MKYQVLKQIHPDYGNVILIQHAEDGFFNTPFQAERAAKREYQNWKGNNKIKIRFLIDQEILQLNQLEHWANEEYTDLPKCQECAQILDGKVYNHSLSDTYLFCSINCCDRNYAEEIEHLNDYEEFDS
jgi:hypothetical protein